MIAFMRMRYSISLWRTWEAIVIANGSRIVKRVAKERKFKYGKNRVATEGERGRVAEGASHVK
jgi:hypothetical protein